MTSGCTSINAIAPSTTTTTGTAIENPIENLPNGCYTILNNGPTSSKINIYFYDTGFDSDPEIFNSFVKNSYVSLLGNSIFPGIEPYKSLKQEFNVYSFRNSVDLFNCGNDIDDSRNTVPNSPCHYDYIKNKLLASCPGFSAPSGQGESDGNYNIIILPLDGGNVYSSVIVSARLNGVIVSATLGSTLSSSDLVYINLAQGGNSFSINSWILAHELGHKIGFFGEEYGSRDFLNTLIGVPNIDSAECKKWCQGADTQSACYDKYSQFVGCFKNKFILKIPEIQSILNENSFDYNSVKANFLVIPLSVITDTSPAILA